MNIIKVNKYKYLYPEKTYVSNVRRMNAMKTQIQ